ncbi:MAG TPA: hypothetical protein VGE40_12285 [Bacilli bacterium]
MVESFKHAKLVPHYLLQERLEMVKELNAAPTETYEIVKDKETGEHYLLYYYVHQLIADNDHKETYYHLMPLETDEVLAIIIENGEYSYPDYWTRPFLRNSSRDENYVWFDPAHQAEFEENEVIADKLKKMLAAFKQSGSRDEEAVRKLLDELDKI